MPTPTWDISAAAPPTLDHLIGNKRVVEQVRITLESCFADHRPFPHALFTGVKGTGKTLLANVVAREMAVPFTEIIGQTITWAGDLNRVLLDLAENAILFVDEIHTLPDHGQIALFKAVEERKVFLEPTPNRPHIRAVKIPPFTLLAATTHEGGVLPPLMDRFKLICRMSPLTVEEMVQLLHQRAHALHWQVEPEVLRMVAERTRGVPRVALRLFESCYRTSRSDGSSAVRAVDASRTFELEGITGSLGLSELEAAYLRLLADAQDEDPLPTRLNVLASMLGVPSSTLTNMVEPPLLREGLITKSASGRQITPKGRAELGATET